MDVTRLYFAIVLGASATAALLAAMAPWLAPPSPDGRREPLGSALWSLWSLAGLAAAVALVSRSALRPWHAGAGLVAALALTQLGGPVARALGRVPASWLVAFGAVRVAGAVRFAALSTGWLPRPYALVAGVGDLAVAAAALWVATRHGRDARAVRAWSALSLATLAASWALQWTTVRPLPAFEALHGAWLWPALAFASVAAALRGRRGLDGGGASTEASAPEGALS